MHVLYSHHRTALRGSYIACAGLQQKEKAFYDQMSWRYLPLRSHVATLSDASLASSPWCVCRPNKL